MVRNQVNTIVCDRNEWFAEIDVPSSFLWEETMFSLAWPFLLIQYFFQERERFKICLVAVQWQYTATAEFDDQRAIEEKSLFSKSHVVYFWMFFLQRIKTTSTRPTKQSSWNYCLKGRLINPSNKVNNRYGFRINIQIPLRLSDDDQKRLWGNQIPFLSPQITFPINP